MRKYDSEFKQRAVKKILDGQSVASVARQLGVAENLLHNWKKARTIASSDLERENLELRKRLKEIEMERDILKKAALIFGRGKLKRYIFIAVEKTNYSVRVLCRVMQVSSSGYYEWRRRQATAPRIKPGTAAQLVKNCFLENSRRYGSRRICAALHKSGARIGRFQVRRLMREQNLRAIQPKKFVPKTTDSRGTLASPNLLKELAITESKAGKVIMRYEPDTAKNFHFRSTMFAEAF